MAAEASDNEKARGSQNEKGPTKVNSDEAKTGGPLRETAPEFEPKPSVYTIYIPLIVLAFWGAPYATYPTF